MNWFQYIIANQKRLWFLWRILENEKSGVNWSEIQSNSPTLMGVKLWIPQTVYLYAGYIDLHTHEIHEDPHASPFGKARLKEVHDYLEKECKI